MDNEMLNVMHLGVSFEGEEILKDLSFRVNKGEVLVILGPNGAGKTTLFKAILGLLPYKGEIIWKTDKISFLPHQELLHRKDIPPLTLEEFFDFKKVSRDKIPRMLTLVGLDPKILERNFNTLSSGQFQRMLIAWGLIDEPDVLLFDEPTSGIDLGGQETIYSLLRKFWEEHRFTILLITHDLNVVWKHADNVLCLNKSYSCYGRPTEMITPSQLEKLYGTGVEYYRHSHTGN